MKKFIEALKEAGESNSIQNTSEQQNMVTVD